MGKFYGMSKLHGELFPETNFTSLSLAPGGGCRYPLRDLRKPLRSPRSFRVQSKEGGLK